MNRRALLQTMLLGLAPVAATAQTFTPQSPSGLNVTFTTEKAGGTRVIVFGEIRNTTGSSAQHVVLIAEGFDEAGHVVSRGRGYILGVVPSRGSSSFEIRLNSSGSEKRYRVQIESFEFSVGGG